MIQIPATPVAIPNAFNSNDGPAPYTVLEVEFMNLQLPLPGLTLTPLVGNNFALASAVTPMALVSFLDAGNTPRTKFLQVPLQLMHIVTLTADPDSVVWWAFLESGSIRDVVLSGADLSFNAAGTFHLIAIPPEPLVYPVLQDFACSQQAPFPTTCRNLYPLQSYCQVSGLLQTFTSPLRVPYVPVGPRLYRDAHAETTDSPPYVLRVTPQDSGDTLIDVAFPIVLSFSDANGQRQTQPSFLFIKLLIAGMANVPATHSILNWRLHNIFFHSGPFIAPVLEPLQVNLTGISSVIDHQVIEVPTANIVQCGDVPFPTCPILPIIPPDDEN